MNSDESKLYEIIKKIRQIPNLQTQQDLERRFWDVAWPCQANAAQIYSDFGEQDIFADWLVFEDPAARPALRGIEAELACLIPGYKPQIQ